MKLGRWLCFLHPSSSIHHGDVIEYILLLEKCRDVGTPLGWSMSHGEGDCHGPTVFGFTLLRLTCQKLANLNKNDKNKKFCLLINIKSHENSRSFYPFNYKSKFLLSVIINL